MGANPQHPNSEKKVRWHGKHMDT